MADLKVYTQEVIEETPFPQDEVSNVTTTQSSSGGNYKATEIKDGPIPAKRIAVEVIGSVLNTQSRKILQEFQFTKSGAIQVGEYENGLSGDLRISPNGITARDKSGITTFAIDGTTGSATFAGTVQAGTLISGKVVVGNNNVIIDGENRRMLINDGTNDIILIGYQSGGF